MTAGLLQRKEEKFAISCRWPIQLRETCQKLGARCIKQHCSSTHRTITEREHARAWDDPLAHCHRAAWHWAASQRRESKQAQECTAYPVCFFLLVTCHKSSALACPLLLCPFRTARFCKVKTALPLFSAIFSEECRSFFE